jgi:4-amino-4-deoxy-L-arabinose transferase-like glycosyltransferase
MAYDKCMKDRIALIWAAVTLVAHVAVAGRYGFFRDELYFIVCGQHPAFGYADQPPLVPLLAAGTYALGHQLWMVRLIPALAAAGTVLAAVAFARLFGARDFAAHLTGVTVATAPLFLGLGGTFNTTVFEPVAWTLLGLLFARALLRDDARSLVWAGLVAGLALEAKYFIVVWIAALGIAFALSSFRSLLGRREVLAGAAITIVIAAPSILWQAAHGWPFAQLVANAGQKNAPSTVPGFALSVLLGLNPLAAPVWLAGFVAPFVLRDLSKARAFSVAFGITVVLTYLGGGKDYYVAAAFPLMFALGSVAIERWAGVRVGVVYACAIGGLAAVLVPAALPVLPPADVHPYFEAIHVVPKARERGALGLLPQIFADQFGWPELAAVVAKVYDGLPPGDRAKAYVLAGNYGEAAAIDVFDAGRGLPPTLSGHNQYYFWGPHGYDGSVLIDVGATVAEDLHDCRSATLAATFSAPYVMPHEDHLGIVVCRGLRKPVGVMWPHQKQFI